MDQLISTRHRRYRVNDKFLPFQNSQPGQEDRQVKKVIYNALSAIIGLYGMFKKQGKSRDYRAHGLGEDSHRGNIWSELSLQRWIRIC